MLLWWLFWCVSVCVCVFCSCSCCSTRTAKMRCVFANVTFTGGRATVSREVAREPESGCRALLSCPIAHARRHARAVLSHARATAAQTAKSFRALIMGGASPYLGAVRAEQHVGPAARSLRFALLEQPGLGALSSVRRANVRSRSEIRIFASEGTKQGRNNHQTTILGLVRPTVHGGAPRVGFPPPLTLPCCGTYLQPEPVANHNNPCQATLRFASSLSSIIAT